MDWTKSGIKNSFEYELVDPVNLDISRGFLSGVTTATINEEDDSELFSKLEIELDGDLPDLTSAIRVWHIAELDGEIEREELGTFMQDSKSPHFELGRYSGSLTLYSPLIRLKSDLRHGNSAVAKNTLAADKFASVVTGSKGTCFIDSSLKQKRFSDSKVWEAGKSSLEFCALCASVCNAHIEVDTHGRVGLMPNVYTSQKTPCFEIPIGESSITYLGVDIEQGNMYNKVVASFERNSKKYFAKAEVEDSHPWAFSKLGRWITENLTVKDISENATAAQIQNALNTQVRARLKEITAQNRVFSCDMLYMPIKTGSVGYFEYQDSQNDKIERVRAVCSARQIELDKTMRCSLTFTEVL